MDTSLANSRSEKDADILDFLQKAWKDRATDLHFEPYPDGGQIRFRVDRFFRIICSVERVAFDRLIGRIRVLAHLPSYESSKPQEGRIRSEESGIPADVRVSILPAVEGEKAVLRILALRQSIAPLQDLGFSAECVRTLQRVSDLSSGMVLVCGPSGSGKTTTLYSLVQNLMLQRRNEWQFVSVEDPVERRIPGMTQIEVKPQYDLSFPSALKYLLRQDPEVILVGEIRDAETAAVAVQAAFTGHLVLSTMHTAFASEAWLRLNRMGIPEYQIHSSLNLIFTQRLLRKKCALCQSGCDACDFTGFHGLIPVGECSYPDEFTAGSPIARKNASEVLRQQAEELSRQGLTSEEEIRRVFQ